MLVGSVFLSLPLLPLQETQDMQHRIWWFNDLNRPSSVPIDHFIYS